MSSTAPRVVSGAAIVLRLYDIAHQIDLARAEALAAAGEALPGRRTLTRAKPKALAFDPPPLQVELGEVPLMLPCGPARAAARARVYDFGAVSIALRVPIGDVGWGDFVAQVHAVDAAAGEQTADAGEGWRRPHRQALDRLLALIGPALDRPGEPELEEDYLVSVVQETDPALSADAFLETADLVSLFAGTPPVSEAVGRELLKTRFSYYPDDLAVVTWDHAFLLEPAGDTEVADILEVANVRLLEMRYYDARLDRELPAMYDRVAAARRVLPSLARRRYANLARGLYTRVAEVTEITQRAGNALRVTEDVYLARIYAAALDAFRVPVYVAAVEQKLALMRDTYGALYEEASTGRAEILEAAIVLLIVLEIVLMMLWL